MVTQVRPSQTRIPTNIINAPVGSIVLFSNPFMLSQLLMKVQNVIMNLRIWGECQSGMQ